MKIATTFGALTISFFATTSMANPILDNVRPGVYKITKLEMGSANDSSKLMDITFGLDLDPGLKNARITLERGDDGKSFKSLSTAKDEVTETIVHFLNDEKAAVDSKNLTNGKFSYGTMGVVQGTVLVTIFDDVNYSDKSPEAAEAQNAKMEELRTNMINIASSLGVTVNKSDKILNIEAYSISGKIIQVVTTIDANGNPGVMLKTEFSVIQ